MDATLLAGIASMILSLGFSYIPGIDVWFAGLEKTTKQLIMGGLIVLVGAGAFGLGCVGWIGGITCDQAGATGLITAIIAALVANQAIFGLTPQTKRVEVAKAETEEINAALDDLKASVFPDDCAKG